jgi:hypothetical protein
MGLQPPQQISITSSGTAITFNTNINYAPGDVHGSWLSVQDLSTSQRTTGSARITSTVGSGATLGLLASLNDQIGVSDTATVTLTAGSQTITIPMTLNST